MQNMQIVSPLFNDRRKEKWLKDSLVLFVTCLFNMCSEMRGGTLCAKKLACNQENDWNDLVNQT